MLPILLTAGRFLVNTLFAAGTVAAVIQWFRQPDDREKALAASATEAGVPLDTAKQLGATVLYNRIEEDGGSPDQFWAQAPQDVKDSLQFSPESLRRAMDRTSFLGMADSILFAASTGLGLFTVFRGIPIGLKALAKIAEIRKGPHTAADVQAVYSEFLITSVTKLGLPGFIAGVLGYGGWKAGSWANSLNDADLWGRINLAQLEEDLQKAKRFKTTGGAEGAPASNFLPTLTKSKAAKPKMFLGVVYSGKLAETADFVRTLDDKITSDQDLFDDIEINLTSWLGSIGDRIAYEVQLKQDPYDIDNTKKLGTWYTLSLYYSGKGGKRIFIDEILLGPTDPAVYWPTERITETIRSAVTSALTPELLIPKPSGNGGLLVPTREGETIQVLPPASPTQTPAPVKAPSEQAPVSTPAPTPAPSSVKRGDRARVNAPGVGLNLREGPNLNARVNITAPHGAIIDLDPNTDFAVNDGHRWLLANYNGSRGWVATEFLVPEGSAPAPTPTPAPAPQPAPVPAPSSNIIQQLFPSLPNPQPAPSTPAPPAATTQQVRTNTGSVGLNLRSAPSLSASVLATIPNGTVLTVSNSETAAEGYRWVQTVYQTRAGWIAKEFLVPA